MLNFTDIDFNAVWQETFGWNAAGDTDNRKFNDQAENDFWVRLAPRYTQEYNLNHDTGLIADKLAGLLGRNKTILEMGCGSGNFTLLMAQYSQQILGLDFSPAMLAVLEERRGGRGVGDICTRRGGLPKVSAIFARRQANGKILQLTLYSTTSSVSIHSTVSAT